MYSCSLTVFACLFFHLHVRYNRRTYRSPAAAAVSRLAHIFPLYTPPSTPANENQDRANKILTRQRTNLFKVGEFAEIAMLLSNLLYTAIVHRTKGIFTFLHFT